MSSSNTKPDFDRFLAAVTRKGLPDRLPVAEIEVDADIMEAFLGHPIANLEQHAGFWRSAGYDYALLYVRGQPLPDHFFQTKIGQRHEELEAGTHSRSTFEVELGVKDERTFEAYPWIGPDEVYYRDVDGIRPFLPDGMKLVVNQGPLFSGIWRLMGLETFSVACVENPSLVKAVAEKMGELCVDIARNLLQREWVGAYWLGDDMAYTTGLMVSPDFLRTYVFPYYQRIGQLARQYRKPFLLHSDGKLTQVFEDILQCGVTAIHPNEPTSVNLVDLKRQYGERLSFLGGMDVDLLGRGTVAEIKLAVRRLIETVAPGGGFALGSGNSVPKYVPVENYRAMLDAVKEFGNVY